jgi:hypothetical protein
VVFSYTIKPVIYGSLAARMTGVPRIYSMITGLGHVFTTETGGGAAFIEHHGVARIFMDQARRG